MTNLAPELIKNREFHVYSFKEGKFNRFVLIIQK